MATGATLALVAIAAAALAPFTSEWARRELVKALSTHLDGEVDLADFRIHFLPLLHAEASRLTIRHRARHDIPPLLSIKHFAADGSVLGLWRGHISRITLEGLDIEIPPVEERGDKAAGNHTDGAGQRDTTSHADTGTPTGAVGHSDSARAAPSESARNGPQGVRSATIDDLIADNTRFVLLPSKPEDKALAWDIHHMHMLAVTAGQPIHFEANLTNALPPGEVTTRGTFGPWEKADPSQTALDGVYRLDSADLSVWHGISGDVTTDGTYTGRLENMDIHGHCTVPELTVGLGGHPMPVQCNYHTIIDGTTGATYLEEVTGKFWNTPFVAKGSVLETETKSGRAVAFDVTMDSARLEDVLRVALKGSKMPLTGRLYLKTKFVLQPGDADVVQRLTLDGTFATADTRFTNAEVGRKIDELSHRSRGKSLDSARAVVASRFAGRVSLRNSVLTIPKVTFDVPGAVLQLAGVYAMLPDTLSFAGTLYTQAKISEMTSGFQHVLLKLADPLFKSERGGSAIPIKVHGPRGKPEFGLDKSRVFKHK